MYRGILRGKRRVEFPWLMARLSALVRLVPDAVYDRLSIVVRKLPG
jgi:hypothetical protein